jgi:hypothetical protein
MPMYAAVQRLVQGVLLLLVSAAPVRTAAAQAFPGIAPLTGIAHPVERVSSGTASPVDARDGSAAGVRLPPGRYLFRLAADGHPATHALLLLDGTD